ncbi:MAG: hypothetical protein ACTSSH_01880 [Candidatus Heimdallarchaeota archaeon]
MTNESDTQEEEIQSPYLTEEITLKKKTPFHAQMEIIRIREWRIFAHHPTCNRYENHYFTIGKLHLCIGCTMIYSAVLIYAILFFSVPSVFRFNPWVIASVPFGGFFLAIIHKIVKLKIKWLKAIFRFAAGFGIGAFCALIIETFFLPKYWWLGFILIVLLFLGNQLYGISRGSGANRKKCRDCPLNEQEEVCNPDRNTNIRVRKVYAIVEEELRKAQERSKKTADI